MGKILIIKGADFSKNAIASIVVIKTSVTPSGGGIVSGAGNYASGDSVTLTATANPGFEFSRWSDGVTTASRTFTATSGLPTFIAEFTKETIVTVPEVVVELKTDINKIHINNTGGGSPRATIFVNDVTLMLRDYTKITSVGSNTDISDFGIYVVTGKDSLTLHVDVEKANSKNAIKWSFGVVDIDTMSLLNEWKWHTEDVIVSGLDPSKTYAVIGNFANDNPATPIPPLIHGTDFIIS